jgi:hypothetical protein
MADIFGIDSDLGGVFKGSKFSMAISGRTGSGQNVDFEGALVQNLQISYQRQISRFWALGSNKQYFIEGRTEGQATLGRIVGPQGLIDNLVEVLADLCSIRDRNVTVTANERSECVAWNNSDTNRPATLALSMWGAVSTGVSFGADAQQFIVNSAVNIMFASLRKA